jgi:23S rRNA (cytidine1920-2'-O)/16S rRNA (cytidine1409-2'-O)-methyltransferase
MARSRLDIELVNRGLIPSREKAKVAVLAGKVMVNGQRPPNRATGFIRRMSSA